MINFENYIASIPNFPKEGILFRDITPLLEDGEAFNQLITQLCEIARKLGATKVVGPESRGFILAAPIAAELKIGFVPVRRPNKLPREKVVEEYDLEYGTNMLSIHTDSIKKGDKVLVVDDLLATGGTCVACNNLIEKLGGKVVGDCFVIELTDLPGREALKGHEVFSIIKY